MYVYAVVIRTLQRYTQAVVELCPGFTLFTVLTALRCPIKVLVVGWVGLFDSLLLVLCS